MVSLQDSSNPLHVYWRVDQCLHSKFNEVRGFLGACTDVQGCRTTGCGVPCMWDLECKLYGIRSCRWTGCLCRISASPAVHAELQQPEKLYASKQNKKNEEKGERNTTCSCTNIKISSLRDPAQVTRECSRVVGDV